MQPAREIASAARNDRVLGKPIRQPAHELAVLELARHGPRLGPLEILLARRRGRVFPALIGQIESLQGVDELRIAGIDRQRRAVNTPELLRAGVNVDQRLFGYRRPRRANSRSWSSPPSRGPIDEQDIGLPNSLADRRVRCRCRRHPRSWDCGCRRDPGSETTCRRRQAGLCSIQPGACDTLPCSSRPRRR